MSNPAIKPCLTDRVRFSELDPQGVVFYSRYFEYADAAIMAYFRNKTVSNEMQQGYDFQVKSCFAEYLQSLKMEDEYCAYVSLKKLGTSSISLLVSIHERFTNEPCCAIEVLQVYVNLAAMKSAPIPKSLRSLLAAN